MLTRLRQEWKRFVDADAGIRFQRLHERKCADGRGIGARLFWLGMGCVLTLAGLVMLFTPGPGVLTLALGLACFAQESLPFARRCDRAELRMRNIYARWRARQRKNADGR